MTLSNEAKLKARITHDVPDVTSAQLDALRAEAAAAGDDAQVALCVAALNGETRARVECARVIAAAADA